MSRTFFAFPIAIALGLTLGLSGQLNPAAESNKVLPVLAQGGCTHGANWICTGPTDPTKTSAMTVTYADVYSSSVIPNGATDWDITAHWYPAGPGSNCADSQVATCTVTWNGSAWSLSNVNLTNDIVAISLCNTNMCGGSSLAVGYTLIVSINDPSGTTGNNLDNVDYVTTAVPNGTVCGASNTTPISQTNSGNQYISTGNTNICPFTCSVSGSSMVISYN